MIGAPGQRQIWAGFDRVQPIEPARPATVAPELPLPINIRTLRASGLTSDQIVHVLETEENERLAKVREQNRIRQRNQRDRNAIARDQRDVRDTPPLSPPLPPITPIPTPSPLPISESFAFGGEPTRAELEKELFRRGKQVCGKNSGGLIGGLLKAKQQDVALARSVVELAATKHDPREFVAAAIRSNGNGRSNGFGHGTEIRGSDAGNRARELAQLAREREAEAGIFRPIDPFRGD